MKRERWFILPLFALVACSGGGGTGSNDDDTTDSGTADVTDDPDAEPDAALDTDSDPDEDPVSDADAFECCPLQPPSCDCPLMGGSPGPDGECMSAPCDAVPSGWEVGIDENGCEVYVSFNDESCLMPPDVGDVGDTSDVGDAEDGGDAEDVGDTDDADDAGDADASGGWPMPDCSGVTGVPSITITTDEGVTVLPTFGSPMNFDYTHGLVAMEPPGLMLAHAAGEVLRSTDSGCTWRSIGATDGEVVGRLVAGLGERAYVWADNRDGLFRVDGETITPLRHPTERTLGMATHPTDPDRVRLGDYSAGIWESTDGGESWEIVNRGPPGGGVLGYRVAFDPSDWDHVLYGIAGTGVWVTFDGGALWLQANGTTDTADGRANIFNVLVSPADGDVVWAQGIDISEELSDPDSDGKYVYRSEDGGRTFTKVEENSPEITMTNGPLMSAHPTDPNLLYWTFGTCFSGYGSDLYRYDHRTGTTTIANQPSFNQYGAIAYHPEDPSVMYLAVDFEGFGLCE